MGRAGGVLAAADAEVLFQAEGLPSSRISAAGEGGGIRVPAVDVLPLLAGADLAKIDVEGGEWSLLTDPRLAHAPVPAIDLEHDPGPLCPFEDAAASALAILREAGYNAQPA